MLPRQVLGREVVELVVAGDPDLGGQACLGGAVQRLEHAALDLASALGRDLDQRLQRVVAVRLLDRVREPARAGSRRCSTRAAAGRLDEHRVAEPPDAMGDAVRVAVPLRKCCTASTSSREDRPRRARPSCTPCPCADGTGQHARADVADSLAISISPGWCRPRPTGRAARGRPRRPHRASAAATARARPGRWRGRRAPGSPRPDRRRPPRGNLVGTGDLQRLGVARLQHPAAVGGDADRHHVVRRPVDGQHAPRGHARDGVLADRPPNTMATLLGLAIGPVNLAS